MFKSLPVVARLLSLSILAGLLAGAAVSMYVLATQALSFILFFGRDNTQISSLSPWYLYAVPTLAILVVNRLIEKEPSVREYGVTEIAEAVGGNKAFITLRGLLLKIVASVLSLSSGFSVGNEGPSAAIGAMIAYQLNRFVEVPERFVRLILSIGASSGIAAVFVSPVTGIVFAAENIAHEFVQRLIGPIVLGSLIAFSVAVQFLDPLIFRYSIGRALHYEYMLATLLFVPVILVFLFIYLTLKDKVFNALNRWTLKYLERWRNLLFALIGGVSIGTLLVYAPFAAFSGHEVVASLINDSLDIPLTLIVGIVLLRIVGTTVSLYANAVGGLFLPLMSIGALVGYGYAEVLARLHLDIEPYSFAAIGAAVFMGVVMRLPLTAIVLALEITYDYNIVVPTGIAVVLASYVANLNFNIRKLTATNIRIQVEEKECVHAKKS